MLVHGLGIGHGVHQLHRGIVNDANAEEDDDQADRGAADVVGCGEFLRMKQREAQTEPAPWRPKEYRPCRSRRRPRVPSFESCGHNGAWRRS